MRVVETAPPPALPCRVLAFDTSTESSSLALLTPQQTLTIDAPGGALASTDLIPDLTTLLAQGRCSLAELDAIAFGCGPGAFTGLRTSCSVAQGLAYGAGKSVLPVDSLMLVAESVRQPMASLGADTVWVAQDARMDEIYAAAYRWEGQRPGHWQTVVAPALYTIEALNSRWAGPDFVAAVSSGSLVLAGSALAVMLDRLACGGAPQIGPDAASSRAAALARLAAGLLADGILLDASFALPLYLRDKVALTSAEREAGRAAKAAA